MANTFTKKTAAIALAAGLAFSGSAGAVFAPVAQAQQLSDLYTVNDNNEKVLKKDNTIIVHKRAGTETGTPNADGSASNAPGNPLDGAEFKIERVKIDMTTDEGFANAVKLQTTADGVNRVELDKYGTEAVGDYLNPVATQGGDVTFTNLPAGAYLITETKTPAGYINSAPFIVFAPMPDATNKTWNKTVHAYPKNTTTKTEKTVVDANQHPVDGDHAVTYTINATAPTPPAGREVTSFSVRDYHKADEFDSLDVTEVRVDGTPLTTGWSAAAAPMTDAEKARINAADEQGNTPDADTKIVVNFTGEGLATIKNNPGAKVEVVLSGKISKTAAQNADGKGLKDGEVINSADTGGTTRPTGGSENEDEPFDTPPSKTKSYFGAVQIVKTGENQEKLEGAKFELHKISGENATCAAADLNDGNKVNTGELVTDAQGKFVINSLHVTDLQNNTETITDTYCLKETEAPSGYTKLVKPIELKLAVSEVKGPATSETDGGTTYVFNKSATVENVKRGIPQLPSTGGMGVIALILAGLALLGGGAYAARRKTA